jgi:hypothetical protein
MKKFNNQTGLDFEAGFVQSVVLTAIEDVVLLALRKNEG